MDLTNTLEKVIATIESRMTTLVNISIFLMMVIISANAIGRYVFNMPLPGSHTIVILFLMPVLVFFSLSRIQREEANINVDVLARNFSKRQEMLINLAHRSIILGIFIYIVAFTGENFLDSFVNPTSTTGVVSFPSYITNAIIPFGFGLLCIRLLSQIVVDAFRMIRNPRGEQ